MHELSVCRGMLRRVEAIARERGAARVTRVVIRIGPLSGVVPELVERAFPVARAGTLAADAGLTVERVPIRVDCPACGHTGEASLERLACPSCNSPDTRVAGGDELLLTEIEVEDDV